MARIYTRAARRERGGGHITTRAHIASDMGPGKGSRIPRDMGPPGTISLAIWYRGGSTKGGTHIATTYDNISGPRGTTYVDTGGTPCGGTVSCMIDPPGPTTLGWTDPSVYVH